MQNFELAFEQFGVVGSTGDQIKNATLMDDAGIKRSVRVLVGDPAGQNTRQRGDMGGMLPKLGRQGAMCWQRRHGLHLPDDYGGRDGAQCSEADTRQCGFKVFDATAAGVVGRGIG